MKTKMVCGEISDQDRCNLKLVNRSCQTNNNSYSFKMPDDQRPARIRRKPSTQIQVASGTTRAHGQAWPGSGLQWGAESSEGCQT